MHSFGVNPVNVTLNHMSLKLEYVGYIFVASPADLFSRCSLVVLFLCGFLSLQCLLGDSVITFLVYVQVGYRMSYEKAYLKLADDGRRLKKNKMMMLLLLLLLCLGVYPQPR